MGSSHPKGQVHDRRLENSVNTPRIINVWSLNVFHLKCIERSPSIPPPTSKTPSLRCSTGNVTWIDCWASVRCLTSALYPSPLSKHPTLSNMNKDFRKLLRIILQSSNENFGYEFTNLSHKVFVRQPLSM